MYGYDHGLDLSELIALLQDTLKQQGDGKVWLGGNEFPAGVKGIYFRTERPNGYYPTRVYVLI